MTEDLVFAARISIGRSLYRFPFCIVIVVADFQPGRCEFFRSGIEFPASSFHPSGAGLGSLQACTTYFAPRIRLRALVCSILAAPKLPSSLCVESNGW